LSWITHGESLHGIKDYLLDTNLFTINIDWYGPIMENLEKGYFEHDIPKEERKHITIKA
jgi:hypothetical protein